MLFPAFGLITGELTTAPLPAWCRVYFTPRDPVEEKLVSLIDSAREKISAAFYSLDVEEVIQALLRAHQRGVEIRLVMDDSNVGPPVRRLKAADLIRADLAPHDFMHDKFVVVDGFISWTGSYNPTKLGTQRDDNNVIVIASRKLAAAYEDEFEEMWSGKFGSDSPGPTAVTSFDIDGTSLENYFSPEDNCARRIIEEIKHARHSINFALFTFTLPSVAQALLERQHEGINVRGVMERGQNSPWNCFRILEDCGIDVRWDENLYYLHHKFFVIDGETVITGSFNPSRHASSANDENLLIIHNRAVARRYLTEFRRLQARNWE